MCNCSDTDIESGNELFHAQTSSYVLVVHVLTFKTKSKNSVGPRKVEWVGMAVATYQEILNTKRLLLIRGKTLEAFCSFVERFI